jgi:hypothetical protein
MIEPAGGIKGHGAVRAYLEGRSSKDVAVSIEDRDYRPRTIANASWVNQAGKSFIWRRHGIENYLLEPSVVLETFNGFRGTGAAWANSLPATENDASSLLQTLARGQLEDHAAAVMKEELVQLINGAGSLSFGPQRPAPAAGTHVIGQALWVAALQLEASRLAQTCQDVAAMPNLQPPAIAASYNAHLAQFQIPAFLSSGEFLIDMKGKDLLAALSRHLVQLGAPARLNQDVLGDELLRVLQQIYQPNSIYQPDDFAELAGILRQY